MSCHSSRSRAAPQVPLEETGEVTIEAVDITVMPAPLQRQRPDGG